MPFAIRLQYPSGPVDAFRFDDEEQAQRHIDSALLTMPRDSIDPRWRDAHVVAIG